MAHRTGRRALTVERFESGVDVDQYLNPARILVSAERFAEGIRVLQGILPYMVGKRSKDSEPQRQPPDLPASADDLTVLADITSGERLDESRISGIDFSGRKISGLSAKVVVLDGISFAGCEIPSPRFRDVRFVKCDLSNAKLRGCEATRVEFVDCRLTGIIAAECCWQDVLIENCDGRYAQFNSGRFRTCELKASNFTEADFSDAALEGTMFARTVLRRADLSRARLRGADLRGAEIEGIIVGPAEVRGAIVSAAQALDLARLLGLIIK